jgi:hypothetical protein
MQFLIKVERNEKLCGRKTYVCEFVGDTHNDLGVGLTTPRNLMKEAKAHTGL